MSTVARLILLATAIMAPTSLRAQLRIATYNIAGAVRTDLGTVLDAINTDAVAGIVRPLDIILLQETTSVETTTQAFATLLNGLPSTPTSSYVRGNLNGGTSGGGRPSVVYNSNTVQLLEEVSFGTVNTSAQARQTLRYKFRPVGYGSEADFYVYNNHYKAGDTTTDRNRRQVEAAALRTNLDLLGEGTSAILVGDFNISSNLESMWTTLRSAGPGQVFDPINREGIWGNSLSFRDVHTQSPVTTARYSGQITGGMDDRFDFQMNTAELLDNEGLSYIPGTYRAFGNNGTHPLNGEIDNASNTAEPANVLTAIANSSDHLPVVADYQLPAKMLVNVGDIPSRVIQNASVNVPVTVENVAPVNVVQGADELDYTGVASGSASGMFSGIDPALGGGQSHSFFLTTTNVGSRNGALQTTTPSQNAGNPSSLVNFSFDVLANSNASFQSNVDQNSLTIDFGIIAKNASVPPRLFSISNLQSPLGITADLDLEAINSIGDTAAFITNLSAFTGLDAGSSAGFSVTLDTSIIGTFEADYSLFVSDENLLGAIDGTTLTLELRARVALGGDANLDGQVSAADFAFLQISFGGSGEWGNGNFNGDGLVTAADYAVLQQNFGIQGGMAPLFAPNFFLPESSNPLTKSHGHLMGTADSGLRSDEYTGFGDSAERGFENLGAPNVSAVPESRSFVLISCGTFLGLQHALRSSSRRGSKS